MARDQAQKTAAGFQAAAEGFGDGLARVCRLYGINPLLGRLYAALFASAEPMSLEALCEAVGAAKSTVSVALRRLLAVRVVRRLPPRADRRDFYEVVGDPWAVFADWNRHYFQPELEVWQASSKALQGALSAKDAPPAQGREVLRERIDALMGFMDVFTRFIDAAPMEQRAETKRAVRIRIDTDEGKRR